MGQTRYCEFVYVPATVFGSSRAGAVATDAIVDGYQPLAGLGSMRRLHFSRKQSCIL